MRLRCGCCAGPIGKGIYGYWVWAIGEGIYGCWVGAVGEGIYSCWVGDIWGGRCDCWVGVPFFGRLGLGGMTTYTKVHYQAIVIED